VARNELAELEAEQAEREGEIKRKRRELPWVPVEKEYAFGTEDGKKQLAELFEGRSQLLAYNIMFGPDFAIGACPGCALAGKVVPPPPVRQRRAGPSLPDRHTPDVARTFLRRAGQ
jgi:predicted dithiol-disulfide oxidoreductase (DUF899 family)